MCERKLFAIVSLTISLRQRKIAYHPDNYHHSFEHNNQENTLINKDSFFDLVSLTLFVAMCERKLFAIEKKACANTP